MNEITQQFREELQVLLDRYKNRLSVPRIMGIAQDIFRKTLSFRCHPELHQNVINHLLQHKPGDEPNAFSGPNPICSQGPDGCCAVYKDGWDNCRGCPMYHHENQDILGGEFKCTN